MLNARPLRWPGPQVRVLALPLILLLPAGGCWALSPANFPLYNAPIMAKETHPGVCNFCKATFSKSAITRHLASCAKRPEDLPTDQQKSRPQHGQVLRIMVQGRFFNQYWMVLELSADATLDLLDSYLRDAWLECCGHMSAFAIGQEQFCSGAPDDLEGRDMAVKLGAVLRKGDHFLYEYDFGSTTELALRVVDERPGKLAKDQVISLARNLPPKILCACGELATQVCAQCSYDATGWLCKKCAAKHECGEEMFLPVVNSPRVGVCAYTG